MAAQLFSDFSSDSQTFIAAKTLSRIKRDVVVYGLGKKEKLPNRFSKTFQYTRYEKLNLPYTYLTEGTTPSNSSISLSTVTATMDQWGSFVFLTDVVEVTLKHSVMQEAIELLGEQAAETIDREVIKVLLANTSVYYGGTATSRATLGTSDYITTTVAKKAISALRGGGARGVSGRLFYGLIDPYVEMDLLEDTTFQNAASYSNITPLLNGEAGKWMGVRWMVSNLLPTMTLLSTPTSAATTGGSLTVSTTYYFKVTAVSSQTGFEVKCTAIFSQATGMSDTKITITAPSTTGYTYNCYAGASNSNAALYLSSSENAAASTIAVTSIPTSGDNPPAQPAASVVVHYSWILGQEAFAVPELMSLQTFVTPKGASDSDPLAQRRKASWKCMFKAVICNESFLARIETASRY